MMPVGFSGVVYVCPDDVPDFWEVEDEIRGPIIPLMRYKLYSSLVRRATI